MFLAEEKVFIKFRCALEHQKGDLESLEIYYVLVGPKVFTKLSCDSEHQNRGLKRIEM